jgi:hypothetical protein
MTMKKNLLMSLLGLSMYAGAAQAQPQAYAPFGDAAYDRMGVAEHRNPYGEAIALLWKTIVGAKPAPRGMAICKDVVSQDLCRVGIANGDLEDPNDPDMLNGWMLQAGDFSPAPYLGKTPDSRVLAMPGRGAMAMTGAVLPVGSTRAPNSMHSYTVRLRARGSGALPAEVGVMLAVADSGERGTARDLAEVTRTVGWDWTDIDFRVDGIEHDEPSALFVGLTRLDNNSSTMLQIDDVRIERTPLDTSAAAQ